MTTLNTIIEEEKKGAKESVLETFEDGTIRYCPRDLETKITSAMQRAYEAGKASDTQENTPDTEKHPADALVGFNPLTPDTEWEKELKNQVVGMLHPEIYKRTVSFINSLLSSRDTYWKERSQVFVNNIIEDIENMKGVYSANDAIAKALDIIKKHTIR